MKIEEKDINELKELWKHYTEIKIKFLRTMNQYTEKEKEMFWEKFYKQKLNIILDILYYNYTKNHLTNHTNPFFEISKNEAKKYREMICRELSKMNIDKIASENTLLRQYEDLKDRIKSKKEEFIYQQEFWKLFMNFYSIYSK